MVHLCTKRLGFTLIELSIVLVIIGLIVGGVLAGQDLIRAAGVRATITQLEKYNTAVYAFYGKYDYLPGDINAAAAAQFGFAARPGYAGTGDGNGLIEGIYSSSCPVCNGGIFQSTGETALFWEDLSAANLIEGSFTTASASIVPNSISVTNLSSYFPQAKLGQGNYVYVWSNNSNNYLGLSAISSVNGQGYIISNPALTVSQAYRIDKKIDDGLPQSGRVQAVYLNLAGAAIAPWAAGGGVAYDNGWQSYTNATPGSPTSCFDNGGASGAIQQFSLQQNGGAGVNCALSFQFQ